MSAATRVAHVKENWSSLQSCLSGASITGTVNLNNHIIRLSESNLAEWVSGDPRYDQVKALADLFDAYDADVNAVDSQRCPWAREGKTRFAAIVTNLDGEV